MPAEDPVHVVWFKRDLRAEDHRPLVEAAGRGRVLPLLVIEPEWWAEPDMSARHYAFMAESATELNEVLGRIGQRLVVRVGDVVSVLDEIRRKAPIEGLWSHEETGGDWTFRRDKRVAAWCAANGIVWMEYRQDGVIRRLRSRDGWAGRWDRLMGQPALERPHTLAEQPTPIESHRLPQPAELGLASDYCPDRQQGGREAALNTLYSFLHERGETYRLAMSQPAEGALACSRMSPHLAWGTISMREIAQATWRRQRELKLANDRSLATWRGSLISFTGRLHWHCHFMQKLEDEPRLEFQNLHRAYDGLRMPAESDASLLTAWCNGETGLPFVDACMRCLNATGWMNFRMRAMLMAVASYHLWLDWRQPGLHLARQFTDYEPGIHWPQTQMQSGTTGINTVRIYNPVKQGFDQDPGGDFVRKWVPELAAIDGPAVHQPWTHDGCAAILDKTYPMPVVDYTEAARAARQRIYGARKGPEFRQTADAIQEKHGSRRSGIPMRGANSASKDRAARRQRSDKNSQLSLELDQPNRRLTK